MWRFPKITVMAADYEYLLTIRFFGAAVIHLCMLDTYLRESDLLERITI